MRPVVKLQKRSVLEVKDMVYEDRQYKAMTNIKSDAMMVINDLLKDEEMKPGDEVIVDVRILITPKKE